jgi:CRISPR-associated protein Cas2
LGRPLYICAYDISSDRIRARACKYLKNFASGYQKSVFECFLDESDCDAIMKHMSALLQNGDRFVMFKTAVLACYATLGIGYRADDELIHFVGGPDDSGH